MSIVTTMIGPFRGPGICTLSATAIAPRRPENHITTWKFLEILCFERGRRWLSNLASGKMLAARAPMQPTKATRKKEVWDTSHSL